MSVDYRSAAFESALTAFLARLSNRILPAGSYSSVSPWDPEDKWRKWAAVWHGFWGRWRETDPNITEKERLKKIKEEAEEAAKKELEQQEAEGRVDPEQAEEQEEMMDQLR